MTNELLARIDLLTEQLEDYKSRCEKVIEYIKNIKKYGVYMVNGNDLLNILQNGSDKDDK